MSTRNRLPRDNPVTEALKAGPRGDGNWPGFAHVYANIAKGAERMAQTKYVYLGEDHVQTMADLGSGHEERMKYRQMWLRTYGYLN